MNIGDKFTVGDLTEAYIGARIHVLEEESNVEYIFNIGSLGEYSSDRVFVQNESDMEEFFFAKSDKVTIVALPKNPHPTHMGQTVWIEGDPTFFIYVGEHNVDYPFYEVENDEAAGLLDWSDILDQADGRKITISKPPKRPKES